VGRPGCKVGNLRKKTDLPRCKRTSSEAAKGWGYAILNRYVGIKNGLGLKWWAPNLVLDKYCTTGIVASKSGLRCHHWSQNEAREAGLVITIKG
jgi:hypothetical protein